MEKETEVHRLTDILVEEVSLVDRAANKRKFLVVKRDEADKAVWSTAFVNNLPDSAFLYVEPGGKLDEEGKTVPRSNRHFPVRGPDGKVDLPHLRNAIARIPQAQFLSSAHKDRLQAEARRMLSAQKELTKMNTELLPDGNGGFTTASNDAVVHAEKAEDTPAEMAGYQLPPGAKAILSPLMQRACDQCNALSAAIEASTEVELPEDGPVPLVPVEFWTALSGIVDVFRQIDTLFPTKPQMPEEAPEEAAGDAAEAAQAATEAEPVEARNYEHMNKQEVAKAGAKMSKDRFARFEQALATLGSILAELKPAQMAASEPAPMAKADDTVARMAAMVSSLTGVVQSQGQELATLRKARSVGNALSPEASPRYDEEHVSWPLDMNSPVTRDGVNKTESFFD